MTSTKSLHSPLHCEGTITRTKLDHITTGFIDLSLPKAQWTHAAHLVTGLYLVHTHGLAHAETIMPDMIRNYNEAKDGINSDTQGYHHTLTIFYLRILAKFYEAHQDTCIVNICENFLADPCSARDHPLRYYSKTVLFSLKARKTWVEPDLKTLTT